MGRLQLKTVPFREEHRQRVQVFLNEHPFESIPLCYQDSKAGVTVVLERQGQIQGLATLRTNAFHPAFINLYFAVDLQNDKYVNELYDALHILQKVPKPLEIVLNEVGSQALRVFLESKAFSLTVTCECPLINLEKSLTSLAEIQAPLGFRIEPYDRLNEVEEKELRQFRRDGYQKTHFWNPPLSMESPLWQETDPNPKEREISWAVLSDGLIVLCSDLHLDGDKAHLGWGWHDDKLDDTAELKQLWSKVLSLQMAYCQAKGLSLMGEFDSLDKYGQLKKSLLEFHCIDKYLIYQQGLQHLQTDMLPQVALLRRESA